MDEVKKKTKEGKIGCTNGGASVLTVQFLAVVRVDIVVCWPWLIC